MRKGFSLVEILTAVVIIAILATITFPGFSKTRQKNEARQAITYLRAIRLAEKMFYAKNAAYTSNMTDLGVEIASSNNQYTFTLTAAGNTFTATGTRSAGNTLSLDQSGTWNSTGDKAKYQPTA